MHHIPQTSHHQIVENLHAYYQACLIISCPFAAFSHLRKIIPQPGLILQAHRTGCKRGFLITDSASTQIPRSSAASSFLNASNSTSSVALFVRHWDFWISAGRNILPTHKKFCFLRLLLDRSWLFTLRVTVYLNSFASSYSPSHSTLHPASPAFPPQPFG